MLIKSPIGVFEAVVDEQFLKKFCKKEAAYDCDTNHQQGIFHYTNFFMLCFTWIVCICKERGACNRLGRLKNFFGRGLNMLKIKVLRRLFEWF